MNTDNKISSQLHFVVLQILLDFTYYVMSVGYLLFWSSQTRSLHTTLIIGILARWRGLPRLAHKTAGNKIRLTILKDDGAKVVYVQVILAREYREA